VLQGTTFQPTEARVAEPTKVAAWEVGRECNWDKLLGNFPQA
jgi:hypothetical protein